MHGVPAGKQRDAVLVRPTSLASVLGEADAATAGLPESFAKLLGKALQGREFPEAPPALQVLHDSALDDQNQDGQHEGGHSN